MKPTAEFWRLAGIALIIVALSGPFIFTAIFQK